MANYYAKEVREFRKWAMEQAVAILPSSKEGTKLKAAAEEIYNWTFIAADRGDGACV